MWHFISCCEWCESQYSESCCFVFNFDLVSFRFGVYINRSRTMFHGPQACGILPAGRIPKLHVKDLMYRNLFSGRVTSDDWGKPKKAPLVQPPGAPLASCIENVGRWFGVDNQGGLMRRILYTGSKKSDKALRHPPPLYKEIFPRNIRENVLL